MERSSEDTGSLRRSPSIARRSRKSFVDESPQEQEEREAVVPMANPLKDSKEAKEVNTSTLDHNFIDDEDDVEENQKLFCCAGQEKILGLKVDTLIRMMKVCIAFPFVIVVSSLNLSNKYTWLK